MTSIATVSVLVKVDSRPAAGVLSVRVASRLDHPAQCEVVLDGTPTAWPLGAPFSVRVSGYDEPLFEGEVTCVELLRGADGTAGTRLRGYDPLHRLRTRQELRVFQDVTVADLASVLATGLTVVAVEPGPKLSRIVQHGQSDLELLTATAARYGRHAVQRGGELRLVTVDGYGDPVPLRFGHTLWEVQVEANRGPLVERCIVLGWHAQRAEAFIQRATAARSGRRIELAFDHDRELTIVDRTAGGDSEMTALAQAALDAAAARAVTMHGVAEGDPRLWAGRRVDLRGVAEQVDGVHVLTEAVHTVDGRGYQTALSTEPAATAAPGTGAVITLGRITAVDDPDGLGRVRVSLPAHGDPDVGWLGVLCPGAGRDKGIVALPDVDDTVVVALPHGEPAAGIVLGSLYGTVAPPDPGVDGDSVQRWSLRTRGGQSVVADDGKKQLRLADTTGNVVELTDNRVLLHAETDLTIEAPGKAIRIRAASVDFDWTPV